MNKWNRSSLAAVALFSLASCTSYSPTPLWAIKESAFAELKPGVTTKAEVRRLIGVPLSEAFFPRQNEEVWDYRYLSGGTIVMLANVYFDSNGHYKYSFQRLDPASRGGSRW